MITAVPRLIDFEGLADIPLRIAVVSPRLLISPQLAQIIGDIRMDGAIDLAIYFQRATGQGIRDGEMTKIVMNVSQRSQSFSEICGRSAWQRLNPHTLFQDL